MKVQRICACGAEFYGSPKRLRCDNCQRLYQNARQRKYQREYTQRLKDGNFKPIYQNKIVCTMPRYTGNFEAWKKDIYGR